MVERILDFSLRHRAFVLVIAAVVAAVGAKALRELPLDAFPDTTPVQVTVNAVAPALSSIEVERQITTPIEQALGGLPGLAVVRSISKLGFSQVTCVFDDATDLFRARQTVSERLASVELPEGIARPELLPVATGLGEIFHYVMRGEGKSLTELRTIHDRVVRPQLRAVAGVAEVDAWGGREKQYHVVVDPDLLLKHDLTLADVTLALRRNNAAVGGGVIALGGESLSLHGDALVTSPHDVEAIVIAAKEGKPVRVEDVARVIESCEIRRGGVTADGRGEVVLGLAFLLVGENGRAVTERLERRLEEVRRSLPVGVRVEPVYVRRELVDRVLETVRTNMLEGALLVVAVLFAFLGSIRAGLIVALAIPLSMLFAFSAMLRFGITGSLMSLGAIDFGLVVDSSVILVENASRRLAEDRSRSRVDVVRDAALEVRGPTLLGELIIAVVYLPILALEGIEGKLFRPMVLTVVFALAGSLVLSLTVMPALASIALGRGRGDAEGILVRALKAIYRPILAVALENRGIVISGAALAVVGGAVLATQLGSEFVPRLHEMAIVMNTVRLASVSLDESLRYGTQIERLLLAKFPDEIERVWTRTGTAEIATDPMGVELSDVFVTLKPRELWKRARTQDELVAAMSDAVSDLPGMNVVFTQPIEMRMNEMIAGVRADVGIKLFGDDFDVLKAKAEEIRAAVARVPGAADVSVEQVTGAPVLDVVVDRDAISRYGIAAEDVLAVVEALGGKRVGDVREGTWRVPLVVRIDHRYAHDPRELGRLLVPAPSGERVPVARLAKISIGERPSTIEHEWGRRRLVVQANARRRDVGGFVEDVRAAVANVALPEGSVVGFGGQFEHLERGRRRLAFIIPIALGLILALLHLAYGRIADTLRVFSAVPFAAVGGLAALALRGMPFSISAGVGFVAVSGISVLGDMVLVSTLRRLVNAGEELESAVRHAAEMRLRPVLMTALVAGFGFVPMAVNSGVGAEVQRPLATVVLGGIVSSTLATLVLLPVLSLIVGVGKTRDSAARECRG